MQFVFQSKGRRGEQNTKNAVAGMSLRRNIRELSERAADEPMGGLWLLECASVRLSPFRLRGFIVPHDSHIARGDSELMLAFHHGFYCTSRWMDLHIGVSTFRARSRLNESCSRSRLCSGSACH